MREHIIICIIFSPIIAFTILEICCKPPMREICRNILCVLQLLIIVLYLFNMKLKFPEKEPNPINNTHIPDNMYNLLIKSILYAYNNKLAYSYDYIEKNNRLIPVFNRIPSIIKSVPSPKYIVVDAISSYNDLRRKLTQVPLKNYMNLDHEETRIRKSIYYMTPDGYVIFYCKPTKFWAIGMFVTMMPMVQVVSIASHTYQRMINKS